MLKTTLIATIVLACASVAAAQSDYKRFEFFGGYSHNQIDTGIRDAGLLDSISDHEGFHGFDTSITRNFTRYAGVKFDFSGHFKNRTFLLDAIDIDSRVFNFLGGVQIKDNATEGTFKPFAHALVGAAHTQNRVDFKAGCITIFPSPCPDDFTASETGFAGAFGGGIDIRLNDRFDLRAIQVDYNPTRLFDSTQHNFRIGVGIVIH